jgi:ABC-type multidrug transport system ATPase subunit
MNERLVSPPDAPALVVKTQGSDQTLRAGAQYRIGRDPQSDIVLSDSRVSWKHAVLHADRDCWILEDQSSTNGTFVGAQRVNRIEITHNCLLRLGHPESGPAMMCTVAGAEASLPAAGVSSVDRRPTTVMRAPARRMRIGRAPGNDLVVADLSVSREHAELRNIGGGRYEIVDLDSHNGTFVNGRRVSRSAVSEQDIIGIGRATFRLVGDELREFIDEGDVSLVAQDLTVQIGGGKILLDHVTLPIGERNLVAILGPSGAGKSTLLGALTGMRPASGGTVLYDNRDLYTHYAELRHRIGLVPQENILHTQLSARRALRYAAELRFPGDTSSAERGRRVDEVLGELGLKAHANTRTSSLSGGQQKRVNVAMELLTKPSLLFLDEPTSGLDPGSTKSVWETLRGLADDGRTVIVVTHDVAHLDLCDRVLMLVPLLDPDGKVLAGGRVAYFGPPDEGLQFFGKPDWAAVYEAFDKETARDWGAEFACSRYHTDYVTTGLTPREPQQARRAPEPAPLPRSRIGQLSTLARRYLSVIASDRVYLGFTVLLPLILGLLVRSMPDPLGLTGLPRSNGQAEAVLLILAVAACLNGAASSVRELIKERPIYTRERAAGLSAGAYLWSKLIVLGVVSVIQAAVLVAIGLAGRPMPHHGVVLGSALAEILLAIALLALASMAIGLFISAAVSTSETALPLLVLLTLVQVVMTGGVIPLNGKMGLQQVSYLFPSRWGFAATASTTRLAVIGGLPPDPLWAHKPSIWLLDMGMQLLLGVIFAVLAWLLLVRTRPGRKRR